MQFSVILEAQQLLFVITPPMKHFKSPLTKNTGYVTGCQCECVTKGWRRCTCVWLAPHKMCSRGSSARYVGERQCVDVWWCKVEVIWRMNAAKNRSPGTHGLLSGFERWSKYSNPRSHLSALGSATQWNRRHEDCKQSARPHHQTHATTHAHTYTLSSRPVPIIFHILHYSLWRQDEPPFAFPTPFQTRSTHRTQSPPALPVGLFSRQGGSCDCVIERESPRIASGCEATQVIVGQIRTKRFLFEMNYGDASPIWINEEGARAGDTMSRSNWVI